jgi:hypothetical protein
MATIQMENCGLSEKLAEHTACRGLVANMAMATSRKKGGNTGWEKKGGERVEKGENNDQFCRRGWR